MLPDPICPNCSERIPPGAASCPYCFGQKRLPFWRGEAALIAVMVVVVVVLWVLTHFATQAFAVRQQQLARQWFEQGEGERRAGRTDSAIADFSSALSYSQDNFLYRLRLAQALAAAGRVPQAQAYLLALWDEEPGNGTVNLELARLAVRASQPSEAERFYHGAIFGLWEDDPAQHRRDARFELVRFLLTRHDKTQAESELIALSADLPASTAVHNELAALFSRVGNNRRALTEYQTVLRLDSGDAAALAGAGQAAFVLGQYDDAESYLRRAVAADPGNTQAAVQLQTAALVQQLDPLRARLSMAERARRVLEAVRLAQARLEQCAAARGEAPASFSDPDLQAAYAGLRAQSGKLNSRALRDPALVDSAMDAVFLAERRASDPCGKPGPDDQALLLLARRHSDAGGAQ